MLGIDTGRAHWVNREKKNTQKRKVSSILTKKKLKDSQML